GNWGEVLNAVADRGNLFAVVRAGGDGVYAPVDEHAEAGFAPPLHAGVALGLRFFFGGGGGGGHWIAGGVVGAQDRRAARDESIENSQQKYCAGAKPIDPWHCRVPRD